MTTVATPSATAILPQTQCVLVDTRAAMPKRYCVYEHYTADQELIFVGSCALRDVYTFAEAQGNSAWDELITPTDHIYVAATAARFI